MTTVRMTTQYYYLFVCSSLIVCKVSLSTGESAMLCYYYIIITHYDMILALEKHS